MSFLDIDNAQDFSIVEDTVNSASGMRKCFQQARADYLIVLQDDVLPCRDLIATCGKLVDINPDNFISLYSANPAVSRAMGRNKAWMKINVAYGLCGYIIPRFMAEEYLLYESQLKDSIYADDVRLSVFLRKTNRRAWVTCPSLVEHICWHEGTQTGKAGVRNRVAAEYVGFERSGLDVDWMAGLDNPEEITLVSDNYERHINDPRPGL